jgi:hypothetical protein
MKFDDYKSAVKDYCVKNSLNYGKLVHAPKSAISDFLAFLWSDPNFDHSTATIGGPPMPVMLWLNKKGDTIEFEQTEYTAKYLRA